MTCVAVLVNYFSRQLMLEAALSLVGDARCTWICVVDNSESPSEAQALREQLPARVQLVVSDHNLGFAAACNLALEHHAEADSVLLLNPDARLVPGALAQMLRTLAASTDIAAVGPRVYWDAEHHFLLPPSTFPSNFETAAALLGPRWPWLARFRAARFRQYSMRYWLTNTPMTVSALSGGHVLLRRKALDAVGGLFDPRFFMYWEDSDLMRRLRQGGWRLVLEPRAQALHLYEHSYPKDALIGRGWPVFEDKYFDGRLWRWLRRMADSWPMKPWVPNFTHLAQTPGKPIELKVPTELQQDWVLEFSPAASFVPSMACFGSGPGAVLPAHLLRRFALTECYVRLGARQADHPAQQVFSVSMSP